MFAVGRRPPSPRGVERKELDRQLKALIVNPRMPTVPFLVDMDNRGVYDIRTPYPDYSRFNTEGSDMPTLPLKQIEAWVKSYIQRKRWDFAWILARLMYTGSLEPADMNLFQWQGFPGASRLWIYRDGILLPTPVVSPVRTILSNWFGLSGGFDALKGMPLEASTDQFLDDWVSPNSPLVEHPPEQPCDVYEVLERIANSFHDVGSYPRVLLEDLHPEAVQVPEAEERGGVVYVRDTPLYRARPFKAGSGKEKLIPCSSPWGMRWLLGQRERVPPLTFQQASRIRATDD